MAFSCFVGSIGFTVITLIFWISPESISAYPSGAHWAPIVIIPHEILAFATLWGGILYFTIRSFNSRTCSKNFQSKILFEFFNFNMFFLENPISVLSFIVIVFFALAHLILLLVILTSVVYCTGKSALPVASINYCNAKNSFFLVKSSNCS